MNAVVSICGSMSCLAEMKKLAERLETRALRVHLPEETDIDWDSIEDSEQVSLKKGLIDRHLENIQNSDVVLIANFPRKGVDGYIGANTLMEIAFSYALGKPVALLFEPGAQDCRLEVLSTTNQILDGEVANLPDTTWQL